MVMNIKIIWNITHTTHTHHKHIYTTNTYTPQTSTHPSKNDNRKPMIKLSVIKLLPLFAQYQTNKFMDNFLDQSLSYLIQTLKDTNN